MKIKLTSIAIPFAICLLPANATAQSDSDDCYNQGRESDIKAGDHNFSEETCQGITIKVGGVEYSTPPKCTRGGAHYGGTIYKCSAVGSAGGYNCDPRGWQVDVTTYSGGACPPMPKMDISEFSWDYWKEVPRAISKALKCIPPRKKEDKDRSATVYACDKKEAADSTLNAGHTYTGAGQSTYVAWEGWTQELVGPYASPWSPFLSEYDLAQTGTVDDLSGTLKEIYIAHPKVPGAAITANVTVKHYDSNGLLDNEFRSTLVGKITSDEKFEFIKVIPDVDEFGDPDSLIHRTTFDGVTLLDHLEGAEYGNAYTIDSDNLKTAEICYVETIRPVFQWCYDPFEISLFEGVEFSEAFDPATNRTTISRSFDCSTGSFVGEQYLVEHSTDTPHPLGYSILDGLGDTFYQVKYSDYDEIAPSVWRPLTVVNTTYLEPEVPTGSRVQVTLKIKNFTVLTAEQAALVPKDISDGRKWMVWN